MNHRNAFAATLTLAGLLAACGPSRSPSTPSALVAGAGADATLFSESDGQVVRSTCPDPERDMSVATCAKDRTSVPSPRFYAALPDALRLVMREWDDRLAQQFARVLDADQRIEEFYAAATPGPVTDEEKAVRVDVDHLTLTLAQQSEALRQIRDQIHRLEGQPPSTDGAAELAQARATELTLVQDVARLNDALYAKRSRLAELAGPRVQNQDLYHGVLAQRLTTYAAARATEAQLNTTIAALNDPQIVGGMLRETFVYDMRDTSAFYPTDRPLVLAVTRAFATLVPLTATFQFVNFQAQVAQWQIAQGAFVQDGDKVYDESRHGGALIYRSPALAGASVAFDGTGGLILADGDGKPQFSVSLEYWDRPDGESDGGIAITDCTVDREYGCLSHEDASNIVASRALPRALTQPFTIVALGDTVRMYAGNRWAADAKLPRAMPWRFGLYFRNDADEVRSFTFTSLDAIAFAALPTTSTLGTMRSLPTHLTTDDRCSLDLTYESWGDALVRATPRFGCPSITISGGGTWDLSKADVQRCTTWHCPSGATGCAAAAQTSSCRLTITQGNLHLELSLEVGAHDVVLTEKSGTYRAAFHD